MGYNTLQHTRFMEKEMKCRLCGSEMRNLPKPEDSAEAIRRSLQGTTKIKVCTNKICEWVWSK